MKCSWCGGEILNGATICPHCDAPLDATEIEAIRAEEEESEKKKKKGKNAILVLGILSLVLADTAILAPVALILAIVAKVMAGGYKKRNLELHGAAKAGNVLATIGLILGIVMTVFVIFYAIILWLGLSYTDPGTFPEDAFELIM